jgi:hypothetical protein
MTDAELVPSISIANPRLSYIEVQIERDDLLAVDRAIARALEGK